MPQLTIKRFNKENKTKIKKRWWEKDKNATNLKYGDLVKVDLSHLPDKEHKAYPFKHDETMLYMGEVERMPGHCIVANRNGQVFWGYHTNDNFVKLTNDEV